MSTDLERRILEAIKDNPDTTQANLAAQLGVAVGSVNWYLKRLIRKGYVKVTHLQRRKLKYFVTPQGLAVKARLTSQYLETSLRVYRELREAARETLAEIRQAGCEVVHVEGGGEALEIFRLSCLEQGVRVAARPSAGTPSIHVEGTRFVLGWQPQPPGQGESERPVEPGREAQSTEYPEGQPPINE
ncbi:MAG TPA: winged helix-turn-helix transcriptional regulator [Anaerolineae bacterium]|nr:winged helix-turn-helix transcriptional regulator [Anaerolineae bacterium]